MQWLKRYGWQASQPTRVVVACLWPWLVFALFFLWLWRVQDVFRHLPAYGDVLEVVWGIEWYNKAIFAQHISPWHYALIFHPNGWSTATLAHTPFMFVLAQGLDWIGGAVFATNGLSILPFLLSFAGMFRLARLYVSRPIAVVPALVFTFTGLHSIRVGGHLHILWASSLLPWLAWALEKLRRAPPDTPSRKWVLLGGLIWGLAINFSLYAIFLGAAVFAIWGQQMFRPKRILQALAMGILAIGVACPVILPYAVSARKDQVVGYGVDHNAHWSASLNSLFVPFVFHPVEWVRQAARAIYTGPYDESGVANLGLVTCLLALLGLAFIVRRGSGRANLAWLVLVGIVLALGPLLKWNGEALRQPFFRPLDAAIWSWGHALKPEMFRTLLPDPPFKAGVPLPGLVLTALVPFWESARACGRYAFVALLGAVPLAAYGLRRLPRWAGVFLAAIWLIEALPAPTGDVPVPQPHPAYAWLASHPPGDGEGIVDMEYPTIKISGETLYATLLHQTPTAGGVGSFWPRHAFFLWDYFVANSEAMSRAETAVILRQYQVRYLFLHVKGSQEQAMWEQIAQDSAAQNSAAQNPALRPLQCFDPLPGTSPWPYPICVAEVQPVPTNVLLRDGWSGAEEWGVWSEEGKSRAQWVATVQQDRRLHIEAFPFCVPGRQQSITIRANGQVVATHEWKACDDWQADVAIPAPLVKVGWNNLSFEYGYAVSPAQVTAGENPDARLLAVGFKKLEVIK